MSASNSSSDTESEGTVNEKQLKKDIDELRKELTDDFKRYFAVQLGEALPVFKTEFMAELMQTASNISEIPKRVDAMQLSIVELTRKNEAYVNDLQQ